MKFSHKMIPTRNFSFLLYCLQEHGCKTSVCILCRPSRSTTAKHPFYTPVHSHSCGMDSFNRSIPISLLKKKLKTHGKEPKLAIANLYHCALHEHVWYTSR